jgi:two-component system sensor histidine kinase DesK
MNPMTRTANKTNASRARVTRWFFVVWLAFLAFPAFDLYGKPRPALEYVFGTLVLLAFAATFVWSFFVVPWLDDGEPLQFRPASLVAVAVSYVTMALLFPLVGWSSIGMLIYAGSFSGAQLSLLPTVMTTVISVVVNVVAMLDGVPVFTAATMVFFTVVAAIGNHFSYREVVARRSLERSQAEVERVARIAERERIARDLHDLLGHTLSVIVLKSELASRLAERDPVRAAAEIKDVERIARESLQEVRSAVRGYRSAGLEAELAGVRLACDAAGLKLELYLEPVALEWASEQALSFVLRESITNVIRYANAKTVWVSLEHARGSARLSVWDDGAGVIADGNGVRGMRERMAALGGTLEINRAHKGVTACVPLEPARDAADAQALGLEDAKLA